MTVIPISGNLETSAYKIDFSPTDLRSLERKSILYLRVAKDSLADRERRVELAIQVKDNKGRLIQTNSADIPRMEVIIRSAVSLVPTKTEGMRYRFMIGANFDFIEGTKPSDLYYHLQVFQPNAFSERFGFVGGIQQNRTITHESRAYSNSLGQK